MIGKALMPISFCLVILECSTPFFSRAQDNYEIQVYGSQTVAKGNTMLELHSNFTFDGQKATENGVFPALSLLVLNSMDLLVR